MTTKPFSFGEVPKQTRCRWFVRRGAATHFDRGFRAKGDASTEAAEWFMRPYVPKGTPINREEFEKLSVLYGGR